MGKIVALGGGVFSDGEVKPMLKKIMQLSRKKDAKGVYLPTAGHDDVYDAGEICNEFYCCGCKMEPLLLSDETLTDEYIREKILSADVIYAGGGNLKFLMDTWRRTHADEYLRQAYENGTVMSGLSSGAMCWFNVGWDDCGEEGEFMFVDCVGLLPFCNCPHFESGNWQNFADEVHKSGVSGIAAENGAAFVCDNGEYSAICGNDGGSVYFFDSEDGYRQIKLSSDAHELK